MNAVSLVVILCLTGISLALDGEKAVKAPFGTNEVPIVKRRQIAREVNPERRLAKILEVLRSEIDPAGFQEWATQQIVGARARNEDRVKLKYEEIPLCFRTLFVAGPLRGGFSVGTNAATSCFAISWGNGSYGFFGIMAGDQCYRPPIDLVGAVEWIPGVYVWSSGDH